MPGRRRLTSIWTVWPAVTELLKDWLTFIERVDSWAWGPGFDVDDGDHGRTVNYRPPPSVYSAVSTSTITAASGDTLGSGDATLRYRSGATLTDGPPVKVYSNMTVAIASGTRLAISPDGEAYQLVAAMCP